MLVVLLRIVVSVVARSQNHFRCVVVVAHDCLLRCWMYHDVGEILRCSVDVSLDDVFLFLVTRSSRCPVTVAMSLLMAAAASRAGCPSGTG